MPGPAEREMWPLKELVERTMFDDKNSFKEGIQ